MSIVECYIPNSHDCIYQSHCFGYEHVSEILEFVCTEYMQQSSATRSLYLSPFYRETSGYPQTVNFFSILLAEKARYELIVFGQFYHFFGLVFGNHYYLESLRKTRRDYKRIVQLKQVVESIERITQTHHPPGAFGLCFHVTEILLQIFFRDDTSDSYGLPEQAEDRAGLLPAGYY